MNAVYHVPGHGGQDRVYLLQRGVVRADLPSPTDRTERRSLNRTIDALLSAPPPPIPRIGDDGVAEMLLVERWFRRNPEERRRLDTA